MPVPIHLPAWLGRLFSRHRHETSRQIVGSTGSGKSEGELVDVVRLADRRDTAVVLLDGHGQLALHAAGHWVARGHERRLLYEPLAATDRVLCWNMLPRSTSPDPARRALEHAEAREELAQCFMNTRGLLSLSDRGYTKEWLDAALALCLAQRETVPLPSLLSAFRVGTRPYEQLLQGCTDPDVVAKFREAEGIKRRSPVQYETLTGPARRLLELTCASPVVRLRCRPGPFDWLAALRGRSLIAFDGGGVRSRELKRTFFLLATLQVLHAVRRQFAETRTPLPVVLVLEEAGAMGLVTPFVLLALQELRKAGLAIHLITQSSVDFADRAVFEAILANTPQQVWYQCLAPTDQELAAKALGNATFDARSVHFSRTRQVRDGTESVATESRGESFDPHGEVTRRDSRTGATLLARYRETAEDVYKTPQLHEQEYRTMLATLRVGERLVRDGRGVRKERVRLLRPPRPRHQFLDRTHAAIERVRQRPLYLPVVSSPVEARPPVPPDAAARLRSDHSLNMK